MLQVIHLDIVKVDMVLHMFQLEGRLPRKTFGPLRSEKASSSPLICTSSIVVNARTGVSGL
jgi:hypothetical protein